MVARCQTQPGLRLHPTWSDPLRKSSGSMHVRHPWHGPLFYNANILPHLDYCCTICGNTTADSINSVVKFQKIAARLILDQDFDTPSAEHFAELNWMIFLECVKFQKAIMMFKSMNNLAPPYIDQLFQHTNEIHNRYLRSTAEDLLYVPKPKCETVRNSLAYSGAKSWNSIPVNVKSAKSIEQFKDRYIQWAGTS